MTITELASLLNQKLELRFPDVSDNWYVSFQRGEVIDGCALIGAVGRGPTPELALQDYVDRIAGKMMAFNAMTKHRTEVVIPKDLTRGES